MILSAHAMLGDRENMLAAGADAYLAKPIAITSMREEISRLMDSRLHAGSLG
jgi:CheY-like chemotaxis protein